VAWKTVMDANANINGPHYITTVKDSTRVDHADQGAIRSGNPFAPSAPVALSIAMLWYSIVCTFSSYDTARDEYSIDSITTLTLYDVTTGQVVATVNVTGLSSYTFTLPNLVQGHSYSYTLSTTNSYGTSVGAPSATLPYLVYNVSTYVDNGTCAYAVARAPDGTLCFIDVYNTPPSLIYLMSPGGILTTLPSSRVNTNMYGIAVDNDGNIYFADTFNHRIFVRNQSTGVTSILAGSSATTGVAGFVDGIGTDARFNSPYGLAVDSAFNVYVADLDNNAIRKITSAGVVTTVAGGEYPLYNSVTVPTNRGSSGYVDGISTSALFNKPSGVVIDSANNLFVADSENNRIRKIAPGGAVTTFAGSGVVGNVDGQGVAAQLNYPTGIAIDSNSTLYVTCSIANTVRLITSAGYVVTIAGMPMSPSPNPAGITNGQGNNATFDYPAGIAVDSAGNIYVADMTSCVIRKITPPA
jgi:sugar lactone lactonase YvrE